MSEATPVAVSILDREFLIACTPEERPGLIAAAAYLVIVFAAMVALPPVNEVPADFSADVLWRFRVVSIGIHVILWTTYGLLFGVTAEKLLQRNA